VRRVIFTRWAKASLLFKVARKLPTGHVNVQMLTRNFVFIESTIGLEQIIDYKLEC
jgi:hypothetical protein